MNRKQVDERRDHVIFLADFPKTEPADDTARLKAALTQAKDYTACHPGETAVVELEADTTYRVDSFGDKACTDEGCLVGSADYELCLNFVHARNIVLRGHNTTVIGKPHNLFLYIACCENIRIEGIHFTYDTPIAVTADVLARQDNTVDLETPWEMPFEGALFDFGYRVFALPANGRRDHSFFQTMTRLAPRRYRIVFEHGGYPLMDPGTKVYLPVPGYGFAGCGFAFLGNRNLTMADCVVDEVGTFVFSINGNPGPIQLTRVQVIPKNPDLCPISSWRDCIHAKDNRGTITFDECRFWGHEDDVLNLSNTVLKLTEKDGDVWQVKGINYGPSGVFHRLYEGDRVTVLNFVTGELYGETTLREVVHQEGGDIRLRLAEDFPATVNETWLSIKEFGTPSVIRNCYFSGTIRIRATARVENSRFDVLRMWTALEVPCFEGPVPEDITYVNCDFVRERPEERGSVMTFDCVHTSDSTPPQYGVGNIRFENCRFDDENMMALPENGGVTVQ